VSQWVKGFSVISLTVEISELGALGDWP